MGRREAWSAEKSSDPRTKPTRWEFRGRGDYNENVEREIQDTEDLEDASRRDVRSAHERRIKIKNNIKDTHTAKESHFHNSRTNLINDRDVYMEDVDEQNEQIYRRESKAKLAAEDAQIDDDSMRRHEIERGSDVEYGGGGRGSIKRHSEQIGNRELYIKDGNAEILQLMTRGKQDEENIYMNVPTTKAAQVPQQPHYIMLDNSGKEILMRRFIEEQPDGKQIIREHYQIVPGATYIQTMPNEIQTISNMPEMYVAKSGPNSVVYSQMEPEVKVIHTQPVQGAAAEDDEPQMQAATSTQSIHHELETSLKQQNALLRQILLEKEKLEERYNQEVALETQSLPGQSMAIATQTDCEAGTQTEIPSHPGTEKRRARSENDDSMSENEYEYVRYSPPNSPDGIFWIKRRRLKRKSKSKSIERPRKRVVMVEEVKRKIRTPIKEESEDVPEFRKRSPLKRHAETKTSMLRRMKNEVVKPTKSKLTKSPSLSKDLLMEISDSLDEQASPEPKEKRKHRIRVKEVAYYENSDGDSDEDEIVIRRNTYSAESIGGHSDLENDGARLEIRVTDARNKVFSRQGSSTEQRDDETEYQRRYSTKNVPATPAIMPRVSRKDSRSEKESRARRRQTESEPPMIKIKGPAPKPPLDHRRPKFIEDRNRAQSESDLVHRGIEDDDDMQESSKSIPKYMEWYYDMKKSSDSGEKRDMRDPRSEKTKLRGGTKKIVGASEKRINKSKLAKQDGQTPPDGKYKPEPLPRKSPPKGGRLLKEDVLLNKSLKPKIETDSNHPLLQHSEHRFEREYDPAPDIPVPPVKLPHYMYPETPPYVANRDGKKGGKELKPKPSPIKENEVKVSNSKTTVYIEDPQQQTTGQTQSKQLNVSTLEDDHDSGIAMSSLLNTMGRRNPIAEKKSVFTIAYDDVSRVKKIQSGSDSPQLS